MQINEWPISLQCLPLANTHSVIRLKAFPSLRLHTLNGWYSAHKPSYSFRLTERRWTACIQTTATRWPLYGDAERRYPKHSTNSLILNSEEIMQKSQLLHCRTVRAFQSLHLAHAVGQTSCTRHLHRQPTTLIPTNTLREPGFEALMAVTTKAAPS